MSNPTGKTSLGEYYPAVVSRHQHPLSYHASHRGHLCQVSRENSTFLGVIGHTTRKKTGSRARFAAEYHHIGPYSHACNSKYAAGSPT